jgi:F-type H+-transporting ATPase subunit a
MRSPLALLLALLALAATAARPAFAQAHGEAAGEGAAEEAPEELDALHHSADGFYLDFAPVGTIELPRVFVVRRADGGLGLDVFASTSAAVASGRYAADAHHGEEAGAEGHGAVPGEQAAPGHESAEELLGEEVHGTIEGEAAEPRGDAVDAHGAEAEAGGHGSDPLEAGIVPVEGEVVADLSFTRHTVFLFLAALLVLAIFLPFGARYRRGIGRETAPRGRLQNAMEALVLYVREEVAKPTMGDKYPKYMPYLLTAFFFTLFANLLGLLPYSATVTSNIAVTAVLAGFTFVLTQLAGTRDYWMHIFNPPGVPALVKPIMVPIEFLGLFTKPFALAIRLFANMTAGHLVILSLIGLIFLIAQIFGPVAGWGTSVVAVPMTLFVYGLELLIAFIQAYVFTVLSALFIGMASAEHEHHGHDDHHDQTAHEKAVQMDSPLVAGGDGRIYHEKHKEVGTEAAMSAF